MVEAVHRGRPEALARGDNSRSATTKREDELRAQVEELTNAIGEAYVELRVWRKGGGSLPGFEDLELIRTDAHMSVERFCRRLGIPRSTYYHWRSAHLAGRPLRRWPAPAVDAVVDTAAEQAHRWSAWGHRKIWAMLRADGVPVSQSTVYRALKRQGLLQPARYPGATARDGRRQEKKSCS